MRRNTTTANHVFYCRIAIQIEIPPYLMNHPQSHYPDLLVIPRWISGTLLMQWPMVLSQKASFLPPRWACSRCLEGAFHGAMYLLLKLLVWTCLVRACLEGACHDAIYLLLKLLLWTCLGRACLVWVWLVWACLGWACPYQTFHHHRICLVQMRMNLWLSLGWIGHRWIRLGMTSPPFLVIPWGCIQ